MSAIPRDPSPESTFALVRDGYRFISHGCQGFGGNIFETRLLLEPAICMPSVPRSRFVKPQRQAQG
jgi:fatty-acid peroxygenase